MVGVIVIAVFEVIVIVMVIINVSTNAGSAAANSKINRTNPSFKNTGEERENTSLKRSGEGDGEYLSKRTKYANFVAASDSNSGFYFVVECKVT